MLLFMTMICEWFMGCQLQRHKVEEGSKGAAEQGLSYSGCEQRPLGSSQTFHLSNRLIFKTRRDLWIDKSRSDRFSCLKLMNDVLLLIN